MDTRDKLIDLLQRDEVHFHCQMDCDDCDYQGRACCRDEWLADYLIAAGVGFSESEVVKPYQYARYSNVGPCYSLKCGRCDKTLNSKWIYCPFCGAKFREGEDERA